MNGNIYTGKAIIAGIFFMSDVNGINMDVFWYMKAYLVTYDISCHMVLINEWWEKIYA